ncbi:4350_t:CDS:2, partial [Funneliformis geosporum]
LCLHYENSIHRDLHSGNILYSEYSDRWYISDFGFCGPADKPLGSIYGNLPYIAPEVINGKGYTFASDIYSIGMLMWEISSGQPPFAYFDHDYDLAINIIKGMRPQIIQGTPTEYKNLMNNTRLDLTRFRLEFIFRNSFSSGSIKNYARSESL